MQPILYLKNVPRLLRNPDDGPASTETLFLTTWRVFIQLCAELVVFLGPKSYRRHPTALISTFQHSKPKDQWRLVVKMAGRAAKFHLWLNIQVCRPAPGCL